MNAGSDEERDIPRGHGDCPYAAHTAYCPFSGLGNGEQITPGGGAFPPEGKDPRWDGTPADRTEGGAQ